ncbi:hypothetical protein DVH24_004144 [Malus domestica]|uniref:PsbP C-terminal domain-containing protein n=1 Tax=Malus domestica TaxID=3750 RepID=A0A498KDC9_MALDO|nr:hypothetical protein DVH24_004144 [Malus domestica]
MASAPLPPPIPSSLASSKCHSSSRSKPPPLVSPSPPNSIPLLPRQKRRELLLKTGLGLLPLALVESILKVPSAEAKDAVKVGAEQGGVVEKGEIYVSVQEVKEPYQFIIPPTWKQMRVANILSGNYCQPKCAEPWVEVKFEDEKQGKLQVVASPLIRLTNKPNATIEDIGNPEKVIASLGPFVTGNTYDPDELLETTVEKRGDLTYYKYALETPFALTGSHNLAVATAKGNTVVLFVVSASEKQWQASQKTLKAMLDSFQV